MCPEPALLVAYLDGTLFHRDARDVDEHLLTCASCTALLSDMRRQRDAEARRSRRSQARMIGLAAAAVAVVAIGVWALMPGAKDEAQQLAVAVAPDTGAAEPTPPKPALVPEATGVKTETPRAAPETPSRDSGRRPPPLPTPRRTAVAPERTEAVQPRSADVEIPVEEGGIVLRGRNANRRFVWRARDLVIEHSTDGGATWLTEHTADHPIRAGAFVSSTVAWLVGENGLVLRRTVNGWFGASAPADGHIVAVRASSPSQATVTLDDGRVFNTVNGGVTWSAP